MALTSRKANMTEDDIRKWLEANSLGNYSSLFVENRIDLDILPQITDEDLQKISIPMGDRQRLMKAINLFRSNFPPSLPIAADPKLSERTEQRQLTVLFADLVGSTPLSQHLDLEPYYEVLDVFLRCCTSIISTHQGFLAQYQGDCVLAYFGFPYATEDDAERAVDAGLQIVKDVAVLQPESGTSLEARVGIATGVVLVSDLQPVPGQTPKPIVGETPNLAARMQTDAKPGTVQVSATTKRLLGRTYHYRDLGHRNLKGFAKPVQAWQVEGRRNTGSRFEAQQSGSLSTFTGRREELLLLLKRWRQAKAGKGQMVLLCGEAGIGKSRLAQELCKRLGRSRQAVFHFQCSSHRSTSPLHPFLLHIERAAGLQSADPSPRKLEKLKALLADTAPDPAGAVSILAALLAIHTENSDMAHRPPAQFKKQALTCLLDILSNLAQSGPVLILLEDLHWIDPTSQELLDLLVARIEHLPVLLVATCRPEFTTLWTVRPQVSAVYLNRFDDRQSNDLVASLLGGRTPPVEVARAIFLRTDGVPLFLEQLIKSMMEAGSLIVDETGCHLLGNVDDLELPATLQNLLLARLDRVPGVRGVAPVGAAIGRTFNHALLEAVTDINDGALPQVLKRLIDAGLIYEERPPPDAAYTFKHALVRDAAYATLPMRRRRALHKRIATIMCERFAHIAAKQPEVVAQHYTLANHQDEALEFWRQAAKMAIRNSANAEAIAHIEAALVQNEQLKSNKKRLANEIGLREMLTGPLEARGWGSPAIEGNLAQLQKLVAKTGDKEKLFSVLHGSFGVHHIAGRMTKALRIARRMARLAEQIEGEACLLPSERVLGMSHFFSGKFSKALIHFDRAVGLAEAEVNKAERSYYVADQHLVIHCMSAWALILSGDETTIEQRLEKAKALLANEKHAFSRLYALSVLASCYQTRGDIVQSVELASHALCLGKEHDNRYWQAWAQIVHGWGLVATGNQDRGCMELNNGIEQYRSTGSRLILPYARAMLADAYGMAGRLVDAMQIIDELEDTHPQNEVRFFDRPTAAITARIRAAAMKNHGWQP